MIGRVGCVNGDAPRVLAVLLRYFSTFILCLSDVGFNDALILHLMHILGKFCLAAPLCLESEFALMFVAVVVINCVTCFVFRCWWT